MSLNSSIKAPAISGMVKLIKVSPMVIETKSVSKNDEGQKRHPPRGSNPRPLD